MPCHAIPTVPSLFLVGIPFRERRLEIIPISPHSHVVAGWMREVDGRKASPSAGRPNITEPKIAVVACQNHRTEPNEGHAQSTPRPRLRVALPSVHTCTCSYKEPRDPDRQTDPSRGHQAAYSEYKYTYARQALTHTRTSNDIHTTRQLVVHSIRAATYIHAYMHITNVCFAQSKHSAARSQVAGMTSGKIFLWSVWWNLRRRRSFHLFFSFVTFPCKL
jgi:hypothetical protein